MHHSYGTHNQVARTGARLAKGSILRPVAVWSGDTECANSERGAHSIEFESSCKTAQNLPLLNSVDALRYQASKREMFDRRTTRTGRAFAGSGSVRGNFMDARPSRSRLPAGSIFRTFKHKQLHRRFTQNNTKQN